MSTTDIKQIFRSPWHLETSLLTQVRKPWAFPLYYFQIKVWLSHFPLSMENLVPQGWNGFYVVLDSPREEVPLLAMVMLSQCSTLIQCEGYQHVLVPLWFSLKAILAFHLPEEEKLMVLNQALLLRIWKEIHFHVMQVSLLISFYKIQPFLLDQFRNTKDFQPASQESALQSVSSQSRRIEARIK